MINTLDDIIAAAKKKGKKRLVVAYAQDAHTLEAVDDATEMGLVEPVLIGDPAEIAKVSAENGIDHTRFTVIAESSDVACVGKAVKMVGEGQGDILMKGLVSTDKYMRGILSKEYGLLPPNGVLSHIMVTRLPMYHKLLAVSDVAVIPYPDMKQKTAIVRYLTETARAIGVERPKIACIAPSEQLLPNVTSSVEAALLAKMGDRGQFGDVDIDGPLALDVALFEEIAHVKKLEGSNVAGNADCLLFPTLDAANVFFKSVTQLCKSDVACIVAGTKAPCVLTSRGDSRMSKLSSIALASLTVK